MSGSFIKCLIVASLLSTAFSLSSSKLRTPYPTHQYYVFELNTVFGQEKLAFSKEIKELMILIYPPKGDSGEKNCQEGSWFISGFEVKDPRAVNIALCEFIPIKWFYDGTHYKVSIPDYSEALIYPHEVSTVLKFDFSSRNFRLAHGIEKGKVIDFPCVPILQGPEGNQYFELTYHEALAGSKDCQMKINVLDVPKYNPLSTIKPSTPRMTTITTYDIEKDEKLWMYIAIGFMAAFSIALVAIGFLIFIATHYRSDALKAEDPPVLETETSYGETTIERSEVEETESRPSSQAASESENSGGEVEESKGVPNMTNLATHK